MMRLEGLVFEMTFAYSMAFIPRAVVLYICSFDAHQDINYVRVLLKELQLIHN